MIAPHWAGRNLMTLSQLSGCYCRASGSKQGNPKFPSSPTAFSGWASKRRRKQKIPDGQTNSPADMKALRPDRKHTCSTKLAAQKETCHRESLAPPDLFLCFVWSRWDLIEMEICLKVKTYKTTFGTILMSEKGENLIHSRAHGYLQVFT